MEKKQGRKNLKKMAASLSALGAGALLGSGTGQAAVIYSGVLNTDVGFNIPAGAVPLYFSGFLGPDNSHFTFVTSTFFRKNSNNATTGRRVSAYACGCFNFATSGGLMKLFQAGAKWNTQSFSTFSSAGIGARAWGSHHFTVSSNPYSITTHHAFGLGSFTDQYALFQFSTFADGDFYGWIHLSFSIHHSRIHHRRFTRDDSPKDAPA